MTNSQFISIRRTTGILCTYSQFGIHLSSDYIDFYILNGMFCRLFYVIFFFLLAIVKSSIYEFFLPLWHLQTVQYYCCLIVVISFSCGVSTEITLREILRHKVTPNIESNGQLLHKWMKIHLPCYRGKCPTLNINTMQSRQISYLTYTYHTIPSKVITKLQV